jgi:hypothetical protein
LEGMISKKIKMVQQQFVALTGSRLSLAKWSSWLIMLLLENADSQWLYCNFIVHDPVSDTIATAKKKI